MMRVDVVLFASAGFSGKAAGGGDEALPGFSVETGNVFRHDAFPEEGAGKAGIKAVACSHRADNVVDWRCLEVVAARRSAYRDLLRSIRANEEGTILADIHIIYNARVARAEHDVEVVRAAANDGALSEVLLNGWRQNLKLIAMAAAEVEVVIDDGICLGCPLQHLCDERTHAVARREIRAEEHDIAALHLGQGTGAGHVRRFLVEDIAGIAVVCKEGEADGTLFTLAYLEVFRANAVAAKERRRLPTHDVCACIADESARHAGATDADDAVETTAAMHRCLGLSAAKEDVENGLAYSDYFPCLFHRFFLKRVQR